MKALLFRRHLPKYLLSRAVYSASRSRWNVGFAPLSIADIEEPAPSRAGWVRLRVRLAGICGTDLNVLTGSESLYLEPEATYPFVPGHEIVGEIDEVGPGNTNGLQRGDRVAVWPILGCGARGLEPCPKCADGWEGLCMRRGEGWPQGALSIGFNRDTAGGWSEACLAHVSQLRKLPDGMSDDEAVMLDPAASSLAALLRTEAPSIERTLVIGGGTIGLLAAYLHRQLGLAGDCYLIARHEFQRGWAARHGIESAVLRSEEEFHDWAATQGIRSVRVQGYGHVFQGIYDRVVVAAASRSALEWAVRAVRPGGNIALLTSPASLRGFDPTPLWYREITLNGIYVYGPVPWKGREAHAFDVLIEAIHDTNTSFQSLVTHKFSLEQYREAIDAALHHPGPQSIKVVFQPT